MLLCRIVEVMLATRSRMIIAGVGVSCFMVLFPSLLSKKAGEKGEYGGLTLGISLTLALSMSILLRAVNSGIDITTHNGFQVIGWILAGVTGILLVVLAKAGTKPDSGSQSINKNFSKTDSRPGNRWKTLGLSQGITAILVLLYFAFTSPNVIARWTEANYLLIVSIITLMLCLFAFLLTIKPHLFSVLKRNFVLTWNGLFVLTMVATIILHQVKFPTDQSAYPLTDSSPTCFHHIPLVLMLVLFPIILLDFILFIHELIAAKPTFRVLGESFTLASLFFLLMIFAQIFTTVYDYIPVIGPFIRDKFWLVYFFVGMVLTFPVLLTSKYAFNFFTSVSKSKISKSFLVIMLLTSLATIAAAFLSSAQPIPQKDQKTALKILTFNIQQGYDKNGLKNYDGQLALLRAVAADVIGLQETDTNRISGGNSDIVRYFADKLNLYSYYGPKTVLGTFGIAMFSKYPIENPKTFFMYSAGEQTATISAQMTVANKTFNVFVTHLGNDGPIVQQEAILQELNGLENVIVIGDFNFKPDTEQYRLTTAILDDAWLLKWPEGVNYQGLNPVDRIYNI
ncbi:MAG: endonuclease/exonuclease/phosphatase family protein, partial [bacterium]